MSSMKLNNQGHNKVSWDVCLLNKYETFSGRTSDFLLCVLGRKHTYPCAVWDVKHWSIVKDSTHRYKYEVANEMFHKMCFTYILNQRKIAAKNINKSYLSSYYLFLAAVMPELEFFFFFNLYIKLTEVFGKNSGFLM